MLSLGSCGRQESGAFIRQLVLVLLFAGEQCGGSGRESSCHHVWEVD